MWKGGPLSLDEKLFLGHLELANNSKRNGDLRGLQSGKTAISTAALTTAVLEIAGGRTGTIVRILFIGKGVRDWEKVMVQLGCC